ncbi:MAG: CARDB domain-containing protein [Synergistaceae bacterium]|nr:CARDB domain-containing protein [Synergistaceae bacterium]
MNTFTVGIDGPVGYKSSVPLSVQVENIGTAAAGAFVVTFFANGKLVARETVDGGLAIGASTTVNSSFRPSEDGAYVFEAVVDGPGNYVIESDETNNRQTLTREISMVYPDLYLSDLSITPASGAIVGSEPVTVTLFLNNAGSAIEDNEIELNFYSDNLYMGTVRKDTIGAEDRLPISFIWNKPVAGGKTIAVTVNDRSNIVESDLSNNRIAKDFTGTITTVLPNLSVESIVSTDESGGDAAYGENIETTVTLKNTGSASTAAPFDVTLYVNGVEKARKTIETTMGPGQTLAAVLPLWTADLLPTGTYTLTAYADSEMAMRLSDRSKATATALLALAGGYRLTPIGIAAIAPDGTAVIEADLRHTDTNWLPEEEAKLTYEIYSGKDLAVKPGTAALYEGELTYRTATARYGGMQAFGALPVGDYTVFLTATSGDGATPYATAATGLRCADDFEVTIATDKAQYNAGEAILITGQVAGVSVTGTRALIHVIGEEDWKIPVDCDASGNFTHSFELPADFGGSYSVRAAANVGGIGKSSPSKVFSVEGVYLGIPSELRIIQGKTKTLTGSVGNVGTMAVSGLVVGSFQAVSGGAGITLGNVAYTLPVSGVLDIGQVAEAEMTIAVDINTAPGTYTYRLTMNYDANGAKSRTVDVSVAVIEAVAGLKYEILTAREGQEGPARSKITTAVRPGDGVSQVVRITNDGTKTLSNLSVSLREKLPWMTLTTNGVKDVLPLSDGLSIRDEGAKAVVQIYVAPTTHVQEGLYEDELILTADGIETVTIPISVYVGARDQGTVVFEVRNSKQTAVAGATVELFGPEAAEGQQAASAVRKATTEDGSKITDDMSETDRQGKRLGQVRFDNIPAGVYTLKASGDGLEPYTATIEVAAAVDLSEQVLTLKEMPFTFS